jgi:hypothetical protein
VRPTYNPPPRRHPHWPYDRECQPPRPPGRAPPGPLVPGTPPTGHSALNQGVPYQFQTASGDLLGNVLPLIADPGPAPVDGRTCALQALGRYLTEIPYRMRGNKGDPPAQPGQPPATAGLMLPAANFYLDDPDPEQDMVYPSIVCTGGTATKTRCGFTPEPDATTQDVYGVGTVVVPQWTHSEEITLHVYASQLANLRGLMSMVEQMLVPADGVGGVLLQLPDYYGEVARFTLAGTEWERDDGAIRNRRSAVHRVQLDFLVVRLVAYAPFVPVVTLDVETPAYADARTSSGQGDDVLPALP